MPRRSAVLAVLCLLFAACGSSDRTATRTTRSTASAARPITPPVPTRTSSGCRIVRTPAPRHPHLHPPRGTLTPDKRWTATLETSCGTIRIRLDVKAFPRTTASFASLARKRFYDGLDFGRVAQNFVIQGGDPRGDGTGGPGYQTVEAPPRSTRYPRGTVAMAKAGAEAPGTAGSQFFIVTARGDSGLTPDYAVVGRVVQGMKVADRIGSIPTNPPADGAPQDPVLIDSIRISGR